MIVVESPPPGNSLRRREASHATTPDDDSTLDDRRCLVAMAFWADRGRRRWIYCQDAVIYYTIERDSYVSNADSLPVQSVCGTYWASLTAEEKSRYRESLPPLPSVAEHRGSYLRMAESLDRVKHKFERASWRIWENLPTEPIDPIPFIQENWVWPITQQPSIASDSR